MRVYARFFAVACLLIILMGFSSTGQARALFDSDAAETRPFYDGATLSAKNNNPGPTTCLLLETQRVAAFFDNHCVLGTGYSYCRCDGADCLSFESPPGSEKEHLFAGAVWFGGISGTDTLVSVAADGWFSYEEYFPPTPAEYYDGVADVSVWTLCSDTFIIDGPLGPIGDHIPLGLRAVFRGHAWHHPPYDQTIIYDLVLTNIGSSIIEQGYVGIFIDGDVYHKSNVMGGYTDDIAGSLPDERIVYIIDDDGDPRDGEYDPVTGVRQPMAFSFLRSSFAPTDTSFNWWLSNGMAEYDFGPRRVDSLGNPYCPFEDTIRSGTPVTDRQKYCILSNGEWDYDMAYMGDTIPGWEAPRPPVIVDFDWYRYQHDPRFLMSLGPIDLAPDSSLRILFTTFTAGPVHVDPTNIQNLANDPDVYLANLDFDSVVYYRQFADTLAALLVKPQLAVTGLYAQYNGIDSVAIEWDPWVFDDVLGYELYLQQIPLDSMPYPGILPPWVAIDPYSLPSAAVTGHPYRHVFAGLEKHRHYAISAAHDLLKGAAQRCASITFEAGGRIPAPEPDQRYVFFAEGRPVTINWTGPEGITVSHYNIYKLDWETAQYIYEPYYDTMYTDSGPQPADSFFVDGDWYYYFALQSYASMYAPASQFSDFADDSTVYVVTAVDVDGIESELSEPILALQTLPRTRDIVAVIVTGGAPITLSDSIAVREYFEAVLDGYDYSILNLRDSLDALGSEYRYRLWQDMMPFELVLFDDGMRFQYIVNDFLDLMTGGIEKYLISGGDLAYFGSLSNLYHSSSDTGLYWIPDPFVRNTFGIDSASYVDLFYYFDGGAPPAPDTLLGCIRADGAADSIPDLRYDTTRYPFMEIMQLLWDSTVIPQATAFIVGDRGEATHTAVSKYPATSMIHGRVNGVKTETESYTTYLFGFHPWYMKHEDSRALIEYMIGYSPTDVESDESAALPAEFALHQNYPNPFNPTTTITFALPRRADVRLDIFNILGQRVRTLVNRPMEAGTHAVEWDSRDESGMPAASGIYLYRLRTGESGSTRKMILLR